MNTKQIIMAAVGAVALSAFLVGYVLTSRALPKNPTKKQKRPKTLCFVGLLISAWFLVGTFITAFSGKKGHLAIEFEMFSERVDLFGFSIAKTTITGAGVLLALILILALVRIFIIPKFNVETPGPAQSALEMAVEFVDNTVRNAAGEFPMKSLPPFMLTIALYMFGCALSELFGLRAPTSDLTFTFALGPCYRPDISLQLIDGDSQNIFRVSSNKARLIGIFIDHRQNIVVLLNYEVEEPFSVMNIIVLDLKLLRSNPVYLSNHLKEGIRHLLHGCGQLTNLICVKINVLNVEVTPCNLPGYSRQLIDTAA